MRLCFAAAAAIGLHLGERASCGLLDQDVAAGFDGADRDAGELIVRGRDDHGVDVGLDGFAPVRDGARLGHAPRALARGLHRGRKQQRSGAPRPRRRAFARSDRIRRSRAASLLVPRLAAIAGHDATQRIDVGFVDLALDLVTERPRIPLRCDQPARDAIAFRGGEVGAQRCPTLSGVPPSFASLLMRSCRLAPTRSGPAAISWSVNLVASAPWRDRVHVDAELFHLQRQRFGEPHHRGLRGRIGADAGEGIGGAAARQVDDLSVAMRLERLAPPCGSNRRARSG